MKANPYQQLLLHVYSKAFLLFHAQISTISAFAGQRGQLNLPLWATEEAMNEFSLSLEEGEVLITSLGLTFTIFQMGPLSPRLYIHLKGLPALVFV